MRIMRARSTATPGVAYRPAMRLARLRRFAVMLVLVLLAELAMPALASTLAAPTPPRADGRAVAMHVHPDGTAHIHAKPSRTAAAQAADAGPAAPAKVPLHCPGCLSAAECALSCLGAAVLPATLQAPAGPVVSAWTAVPASSLLAFVPAGDLDPPRPVPVR